MALEIRTDQLEGSHQLLKAVKSNPVQKETTPELTLKIPKKAKQAASSLKPQMTHLDLAKAAQRNSVSIISFSDRYFDGNLADIGGAMMNENTRDTQQMMASGAAGLKNYDAVLNNQNATIAAQAQKEVNSSSPNWGLIIGLTVAVVAVTVIAFVGVGLLTGGVGDAALGAVAPDILADAVPEIGEDGIEMTSMGEGSSSAADGAGAATDGAADGPQSMATRLKALILNNPLKSGLIVGGGLGAVLSGLLGGLPLATGVKIGPFTSEQPDQSKLSEQSIALKIASNTCQSTNLSMSTLSQMDEVNPENSLQSYGNQSGNFFAAVKAMCTINMRG